MCADLLAIYPTRTPACRRSPHAIIRSFCRYIIDFLPTAKMWQVPILNFASLQSLWCTLSSSVCPPAMRLSLPLSGLVTSAVATNLYVSSYSGTITSLELTSSPNGTYSLRQVAVNDGSEPNPSWLTKDKYNDVIYCVDEGLSVPNGSLASYSTSPSGKLTQIDRHTVISGPVSSVVYNCGKGLALAH